MTSLAPKIISQPRIDGAAQNVLRLAFLSFTVTILLFCTLASAEEREATVEFAFSNDPADVVLTVSTYADQTVSRRRLVLYGDGRTELSRSKWGRPTKTYVIQLSRQERNHLLHTAAVHRLPEWNDASILARMSRKLGDGVFGPPDAAVATVELSVKRYQRGAIKRQNTTISFEFKGVGSAAELFPEIQEIVGIKEIIGHMRILLRKAEEAQQP
ncbi:MAG: hypothetical protein AAF772_12030 [Acidobacteriota bacterium]